MKVLDSTGEYVRVFDPKRNCYLFEHDKVWLDANGYYELNSIAQYKDGSYVIHHINGNRADNRLDNLQLLTRSEHAKLHARYRNPEINERISQKLKGIKRSDETKRRMSEAQKRNPSKSMLGKHHTDEQKAKISAANKLSWSKKSESEMLEFRQKVSESLKGRVAYNKGLPCPESQKKQLSEYWKSQYKNGYIAPSTGRVFVNNGEHNKQIKPEDLQKYLDNGYVRGMKPRKKKI